MNRRKAAMTFIRLPLSLGLATLVMILNTGVALANPPSAPLVRIAELEIDPAQMDAYRGFLAEEIETSVRVEPGVLSLNAVAIKGRPNQIRIMEVYADERAYQAHLKTPHFLKYKTGTAGMVRSLVLIETDPVMLCAKGNAGNANGCR